MGAKGEVETVYGDGDVGLTGTPHGDCTVLKKDVCYLEVTVIQHHDRVTLAKDMVSHNKRDLKKGWSGVVAEIFPDGDVRVRFDNGVNDVVFYKGCRAHPHVWSNL